MSNGLVRWMLGVLVCIFYKFTFDDVCVTLKLNGSRMLG